MSELTMFVHDALAKGEKREEIREVLSRAGWPQDEIAAALHHFAETTFPVPVPVPERSASAKEAFLYLVTFSTLFTSAISAGLILSALINVWVPDPIQDPYAGSEWELNAVLSSVAALIVALPIYLSMTAAHIRRYPTDPVMRTSAVRKWLTYLTMFVAVSVGVSTITAIVYNALVGEIVLRFALKTAVVLLISALVFFFYRWELKIGEEPEK